MLHSKCLLELYLIIYRSVFISNAILQSLYSDLIPKRRKQQFHLRSTDPIDVPQLNSSGYLTRVDSLYKRARTELSDAQNYGEFLTKACRQGDIRNLLECPGNDILSFT